jgi:hypothetical protein
MATAEHGRPVEGWRIDGFTDLILARSAGRTCSSIRACQRRCLSSWLLCSKAHLATKRLSASSSVAGWQSVVNESL